MTKATASKGDVRRGNNAPWQPGEREAALQKRADEAAKVAGRGLMGESGMAVEATVLSCTIDKGEIRCMVRLDGRVWRPEAMAEAKGVVKEVAVPATVVRNEHTADD